MLAFKVMPRHASSMLTRVYCPCSVRQIHEKQLAAAPVIIREDREAQLAARLLQFEETLTVVAREGTPHVMCAYL
ncbi:DALR anticodon-binding domain-containing protein [Escherichia coli]